MYLSSFNQSFKLDMKIKSYILSFLYAVENSKNEFQMQISMKYISMEVENVVDKISSMYKRSTRALR